VAKCIEKLASMAKLQQSFGIKLLKDKGDDFVWEKSPCSD
jgi:hypothetical protein